MAYVPVQRDAGRIMYEGAMQRARTIGQGISGVTDFLYQQQQQQAAAAQAKAEEAKQFASKLKALESVLTTHKDKFKLSDEQLKQFLSVDPNESPKDRYLRVGGFIEGSLKASDLAKAQAEEAKIARETAMMGQPKGQVMTLEQFRNLPPDIDAKAEPAPGDPTRVVVTGYNLRTKPSGELKPVDLGGEIGFVDAQGNVVRREPKSAPLEPGFERVPASASPAPAVQAPASVGMFMPAGRMAPSASLMAVQPSAPAQEPTPATAEALRAIQQPRPAVAAPAEGMAVRPIRGSAREAEMLAKQAEEARSQERKLESANAILDTIKTLKPMVGVSSVGPGAYTKGIKGTPAKNVEALLKNIQARVAFNELRSLKEDKTTLGQVAIKEIELLQNAITALDQDMSPDLFNSQLADLESKVQGTADRLIALEADRRAGLKAPSQSYYNLGGKTIDEYNRRQAAGTAAQDPLGALRAAGWGVKQ